MAQANGGLFVQEDDYTDPWAESETVVLLHGFIRNSNFWRPWVPYLSRRFRVVRPDLRACGHNPDPGPDFKYTLDDMLADVLGVLDDRGIEQVHVVGEGIGGVIGAWMAKNTPDRLRSLTAMAMPFKVDAELQTALAAGYSTWQEAITTLGVRDWWLTARGRSGDLSGNEALDVYLAEEAARTPAHVAVALSRWATTWDYHEMLPHVHVPTLFVWAADTWAVPQDDRDAITSLVPDGRQALIPDVRSQLFPFVVPDRVAPVVAEFLDDVTH